MTDPAPRRQGWWWLLQFVASAAVLTVFVRTIEPAQLYALPQRISWGLLLAALLIKTVALLVHELRIWLALPSPRPPVLLVAQVGLVSGVLNLILPGRAGDIALIALLQRRCGVRIGVATAAIGVVAFLEAAVFGLLLFTGLLLGASQWQALLGADAHARALQLVGLATGTGMLLVTAIAIVGRRLATREAPRSDRPGLQQILRDATTQTGAALSTSRGAAINITSAALQVTGMLVAFAIALPAVGIDVGAPFFAAAGVLGLSAIASIVLPPSYGAGPAAASLAVLAPMGANEADALAYAGAWWILSQIPALTLGLPSMWSLGFKMSETRSPPVL